MNGSTPMTTNTPSSDNNQQARALIDGALSALDRGDNLRASKLLRAIPRQSDPTLLALRAALLEELGPDRSTILLVALCGLLWVALAWWVLF